MAFTTIESQEQLDAIISDRIARAKESAKKEFDGWISPEDYTAKTADITKERDSLAQQIADLTKDKDDLTAQMADKDARIAQYETASEKTKIAREVGLPYDAIDFLQGTTEDEIRQSAESLKGLVGKEQKAPLSNPEKPVSGNSESADYKSMLREMRGE